MKGSALFGLALLIALRQLLADRAGNRAAEPARSAAPSHGDPGRHALRPA